MTIERTSPVHPVTGVQPKSTSDRLASDIASLHNDQSSQLHTDKSNPDAAHSSASVTLSEAQAVLLQPHPDDVNMERVEMLKNAIRNGELVMDTGKIADELIRQAQELIQGK